MQHRGSVLRRKGALMGRGGVVEALLGVLASLCMWVGCREGREMGKLLLLVLVQMMASDRSVDAAAGMEMKMRIGDEDEDGEREAECTKQPQQPGIVLVSYNALLTPTMS